MTDAAPQHTATTSAPSGVAAVGAARTSAALAGAALVFAGQAALLAGTVAGKNVAYQHLAPWSTPAGAWPRWALAVFGAQALLVLLTVRAWRPLAARAIASLGVVRTLLVAALVLGTAAALSRSPVATLTESGTAALLQLLQLCTVAATLASAPAAWLARVETRAHALLVHPRTVPVAAIATAVVAALLATFAYQQHPHVPDEIAYLFQARLLATGTIWAPQPPVPEAFPVPFTLELNGRWFSAMPSGWPFLLTLGVMAGVPWLINPLLGALNVVLVARTVRVWYKDTRLATLAALLLAVSPWHLFLAMSFMSHTLSLTLALVATLVLARSFDDDAPWRLLLAGACIGLVAFNRPLEGAAVALLLGFWCLLREPGRLRLVPTVWLALGSMLTGALVPLYNRLLTGSPTTFPVMLYFDRIYGAGSNALGFGPDRGFDWRGLDPLPGHGAVDVVINTLLNTFQVNTELLGWSVGSLLLTWVLLVGRARTRRDTALLASLIVLVAVQHLYWFSGGPDFGARYWFLAIVPLVALSARALLASGSMLLPGAALLTISTLVVFVPWRAADKYHHYRGMRPDVRALMADTTYQGGVLLLRGRAHPDLGSAEVYDDLRFASSAPLVAWDRDPTVRRQLARVFGTRRFWIVDGPSLTGDGYRVVAGPYAALDLLAGRVAPDASASSDLLLPDAPP
ncbi:MAG: hypothetical protein LCH84_02465 [Gemmatimonadetes bacterium]|nr:hypothetical protein [Gemmatimonadota bacterium]